METAIIRQFLDFFQDFIHLCQLETWPNNDTSEQEITNAFLAAQHIEKCLDRLQKRDLINEFLSTLNAKQEATELFLKNCFMDPSKYVLKKIIKSKSKISLLDMGFKIFQQLYSEETLETYLAELMIEAASQETLLKNLSIEIPRDKLIEFKSKLLMSELNYSENPSETVTDLIQQCHKDTIEIVAVSLLNNDVKYTTAVNNIVNMLIQTMSSKNQSDKLFWKSLFQLEAKYLQEICLKHAELFKLMSSALLDCGKLLREQMATDYFYIDLTYSELVFAARKICENDNLRIEFLDIVLENNSDLGFWENVIT